MPLAQCSVYSSWSINDSYNCHCKMRLTDTVYLEATLVEDATSSSAKFYTTSY